MHLVPLSLATFQVLHRHLNEQRCWLYFGVDTSWCLLPPMYLLPTYFTSYNSHRFFLFLRLYLLPILSWCSCRADSTSSSLGACLWPVTARFCCPWDWDLLLRFHAWSGVLLPVRYKPESKELLLQQSPCDRMGSEYRPNTERWRKGTSTPAIQFWKLYFPIYPKQRMFRRLINCLFVQVPFVLQVWIREVHLKIAYGRML